MARSGPASVSAAALVLCFTLLSGCEGARYSREVGAAIYDSSRGAATVGIKFRVNMQQCWDSCEGSKRCVVAVFGSPARGNSDIGTCWHKNKDRRTRQNPRTRKSVGSKLAVLSRCKGKCYGSSRSPPPSRSPPTSSSRSNRNRNRSPAPKPAPKPAPRPSPSPRGTPSRSNLAGDISLSPSSGGQYIDKHWVHIPVFFKPGMLRISCLDLGKGYDAWNCENEAWKRWGDEAIYAQSGGDGNKCFICTSGNAGSGAISGDVGKVNVSGHDINRLWCKNKAFERAWDSYNGSEDKGPTYCSHVGDGDSFKFWVDNDGNRIAKRSQYNGPGSL